jgi:hypothetical protein
MTDLDSTALAAAVRAAAPNRFADGFHDRVLARLRAHRDMPLALALERQFVRIVPLAAAATILLAAYNWWGGRKPGASPLDAALNLPQVTLSSAYAPATLYGATIASTAAEGR